MKIKTTRFGELEVNQDNILTFPQGIPGFEKCTRFQLFHQEQERNAMVFWLQSLEEPDVAFSVVDPTAFGLNYQMTLSDEDARLLQASDASDLAVMMMVYHPFVEAGETLKPSASVNANINGPLLINVRSKRGMQKVLLNPAGQVTASGN